MSDSADRIEAAAKALVIELGGFKTVGCDLTGKTSPEAAAQTLRDALNQKKNEKLSFGQWVYLFRQGQKAGSHELMNSVCAAAGYSAPQPITPTDEMAEMMKQIKANQDANAAIMAKLEAMQS